jgi:S1-C subfamily serine protease
VPIDTAKRIIPQLEQTGTVHAAYLGLTSLTIDGSLSSLNLPAKSGALVQSVQSGSAAEKAGLRAGNVQATIGGNQIELGGDVITAIDGQNVKSSDDLATAIAAHKPGDQVTVTVLRGGSKQSVKVTLGTRPNSVPNPNTPQG